MGTGRWTAATGQVTTLPGRDRRLRHLRNSHGEIWVNITSSHLVLADFVNLDPSYSPGLVGAYPALGWARALHRALRASRTLSLLRRTGTAAWRAVRWPRLAATLTRHLPRRPARPGRPGRGRGRGWAVRRQWEASRTAVVVRHRPGRRLPLADSSVDHILCAHVVQELPPRVAGRVLAECARILRPGGTLHLVLPDLRQAVDRYVRGEIDADELVAWQRLNDGHRPADRRRGRHPRRRGPADPQNRWHYDEHTAQRRLVAAGFHLSRTPTPSTGLVETDPISLHLVAVRP
ncbi:class I SAM-dependent methyltransferase [Parafrankia sp. EUN1f]|uniref:class I SAM-dependent methyltransferase n=1 Tax=Parafrankia sp. EUN1f TaxID=102897 RepID=UPI001E634024|nr:class I SAM-dependent methyltransferase [Parafrankia sp. EUN1f]